MMQEVQGLIFAVFSLSCSLLFHLSLTVRDLYRSNGVFSIAYTGTSKCFGLVVWSSFVIPGHVCWARIWHQDDLLLVDIFQV